jgi:hypothetical protein
MESNEEAAVFGESLPAGITLHHSSTWVKHFYITGA